MKRLLFSAGLVVATLVGAVFYLRPSERAMPSYTEFHYAAAKDRQFYTGIEQPGEVTKIKDRVYGMVVSHHFYMEREMSQAFAAVGNRDVETVVIVGPDHFGASKYKVTTSRLPYLTPYGLLEPDLKTIDQLTEGQVFVEERPFEHEHSFSALVGMVKYYFPNAKLVPIMLDRRLGAGDATALAESLKNELPENSLVVASVDFSHHQNRFAADFHDAKSLPTVASFNLESLLGLEVDSPQSLYVLEKYLERHGARKMLGYGTNQAEVSGNLASEDVTSYLFAHFVKGEPVDEEPVSLLNFGDMVFTKETIARAEQGQNLFSKIQGVEGNFFRGMDLVTANLEGPITERTQCATKPVVFKFPPITGEVLRKSGVGLLNLANNHSFDCGLAGLEDTKDVLGNSNLSFASQDDVYTSVVGKKSLAITGFDLVSPSEQYLEDVYAKVESLSQKYDLVVVHVHWGVEYNTLPSSVQKEMAHALVDRGADALLGHHPHVAQPLEVYKGKPIFYSLGNFLFDQGVRGTEVGLGAGLVFGKNQIDAFVFPLSTKNWQPELLPYAQTLEVCQQVTGKSLKDACHVTIPR